MIANIKCLTEACRELAIPFSFIDENHNFVSIENGKTYYFSNSATPLNNEGVATICRDKEFSYHLLKNVIQMPKTKGYFDPNRTDFAPYCKYSSIEKIAQDIIASFTLPCVVKQNSGSQGKNVFVCNDRESIKSALKNIFNQNAKDYDFVALAQEYIIASQELRAIVLNKKVVLVYDWSKNFEVIEKNTETFLQIEKFIRTIFTKLDLNWAGLDIIVDKDGKLHLIEINSRPGFENFVKEKGREKIVEIYKEMLKNINPFSRIAVSPASYFLSPNE